jgi:hypothetical protein
MGRMGTAKGKSSRQQTGVWSITVPALLGAALLAAAVALVVWSMSSAGTVGRLEHEEVSAFSRIRIRRDGDVRALTFVRDDGREVVQSRVNLTAPHTWRRRTPAACSPATSTSLIRAACSLSAWAAAQWFAS